MNKYLWEVKYDVIGHMRFMREKQVVTVGTDMGQVQETLLSGMDPEERKDFDFIRQITFMAEVTSD